MELQLREHQMEVIDALREGFKNGYRSQLLYAPTGFGKTEVSIYLMKAAAEKYKRAAMMMDRLVLVDQTSNRLLRYGIRHGVFQADHDRYDPAERLQVCSAQTMESRSNFPNTDLLIVDECHVLRRKTIEYIRQNPGMRVIGLTATPFTKGLGEVYENVVTGATTQNLVGKEWLCPLRVYIAREIDMTGAKKVAGEWAASEVESRGMRIVGDIVSEWVKKTHDIFGKPVKTIVFCAGVSHGNKLVEEFARAGYNFVSISYKDNDGIKREAIEDFSRPDTEIHGLIATDILTRGFDVPDVMIGVSARPFSKSLSSHVQQMGRVMRPYPGKEFGVWLDHSGNYLRFQEDWEEVYEAGVQVLDDKIEKAKKEPTQKKKEESKCPSCGYLWPKAAMSCPSCGHVKQKRSEIVRVEGVLQELVTSSKVNRDERQQFYSELVWYANQRNYNPNWAGHKYKEKFGVWPRNLHEAPQNPSLSTLKWIKSRQIAWAKSQRKTT
jgi:superfamily II DNA or RNA helicase